MKKLHSYPYLKQNLLWEQIASNLRKLVAELPVGSKLEAENKIAAKFGVAIHTVREALAALTQEGLIERNRGRGTFVVDPAKPQHVAIWLASGLQNPTMPVNYWTSRIVCRLPGLLMRQNIRVKLYWGRAGKEHGQNDGVGYDEFLEDLSRNSISAVASISGYWGKAVERLIEQRQVPVTYFSDVQCPRLPFLVIQDQIAALRQGVEHLLAQGCRRIAWLAWRPKGSGPSIGDTLYKTFFEVLRERGVETRGSWICNDLCPDLAGAGYAEFREIWTSQPEKPDGLLVTDEVLFQDVVTAISELSISVPSQLKVVTMTNRGNVSCPSFPATRIEFDPDAQAEAMSEMLVKLAKKQPIAEPHVIVPFRLIEGHPLEPAQTETENLSSDSMNLERDLIESEKKTKP